MEVFLASFLIVGSIGFWISIFIIMGLIALGLSKESFVGTLVVLFVAVGGFLYFQKINLISYIVANWANMAVYAIGYFLVGIAWSIAKFWLHAKRLQSFYNDLKEDLLLRKKKKLTDLDVEEKKELFKTINSKLNYETNGKSYPLRVVEHKSYLSLATLYWPVSMLYTLLDDPLRELMNYIYRTFKSIYQKISDNTSADFKNDFKDILNPIEDERL